MSRTDIAFEIIRLLTVVAFLVCGLCVLAIWGADTLQLYTVSDVIQVVLDAAVIALIGASALLIVIGIPLWLIPKFRRSHG